MHRLHDELKMVVGADNLLTDPGECLAYSIDNSRFQHLPEAVVFAKSHEQIQTLVLFCCQHNIALTCRGRATGTTGAAIPLQGGIVLSFEHMQQILVCDPNNRIMIVQPGITNDAVQKAAKNIGFFWPPDPSSASTCTVGGNLACNAAGPRAVKYGVTRDNILGLTAVTGDGKTIRCGVKTTKGAVGYDLTRLLIGSEGTLAIITEAILKLTPLPAAKTTAVAYYNNLNDAAQSVSNIMANPHMPCALEFMDQSVIQLLQKHGDFPLPPNAKAILIIEADGPKSGIIEIEQAMMNAATNSGLIDYHIARSEEEAQRIWYLRKSLSPILRHLAPKRINEDVVVPVSHIPDFIAATTKLSEKYQILIVNFGHAGNGNLHMNLLIDPADPRQLEAGHLCLSEVFDTVLKLGGTLSGEHGVGIDKRDYIRRELTPENIALMWKIKQQFDPHGILNPGKVLPVM